MAVSMRLQQCYHSVQVFYKLYTAGLAGCRFSSRNEDSQVNGARAYAHRYW